MLMTQHHFFKSFQLISHRLLLCHSVPDLHEIQGDLRWKSLEATFPKGRTLWWSLSAASHF